MSALCPFRPAHLQRSLSTSFDVPVLVFHHAPPADGAGEGVRPAPAGRALVAAAVGGELENTLQSATRHKAVRRTHPESFKTAKAKKKGKLSCPTFISARNLRLLVSEQSYTIYNVLFHILQSPMAVTFECRSGKTINLPQK